MSGASEPGGKQGRPMPEWGWKGFSALAPNASPHHSFGKGTIPKATETGKNHYMDSGRRLF